MKNQEQDLTVGSVTKKLVRFALPLFGANLLQSFYSIADMLIVGRYVGKTGLAAISNASMLSYIITSVCIGMTMGGTVLVSQYKGAHDEQGQKETVGTLFSLSFFSSIVVTIVSLLLYAPFFSFLLVPVEAMKEACDYMRIICLGTIFVFGYNAVGSLMKGFGDSKSPLFFVAIATVANILLDFLFVGSMDMGTKGAAYATILSQGFSLAISIIHLKRKNCLFDFKLHSFAIQKDTLVTILKVGLPTAVQMVIVNISYLLVTGMLNTYGVSVAAASGIGLKINTFAGMPCWAIGQAVTAMAGQNMGAANIERVKKTTRSGLFLNLLVTLFIVVLVQLFSEHIIGLFAPASQDVMEEGVMYLRICCSINSLVYAVMYTLDSFAIGVGSANMAMCNAILDAMVVRLPASWLLAYTFQLGYMGVYIGQALSPILPATVGIIFFARKKWTSKKLITM